MAVHVAPLSLYLQGMRSGWRCQDWPAAAPPLQIASPSAAGAFCGKELVSGTWVGAGISDMLWCQFGHHAEAAFRRARA